MNSVLVLFAEGSEELEAITIVNILRRASITVTLAGLHAGTLQGSRGVTILPDSTLDQALANSYDMVVLPGGQPGTNNLKSDARVLQLVQKMAQQGEIRCRNLRRSIGAGRSGLARRQARHQLPRRTECLSTSAATACSGG